MKKVFVYPLLLLILTVLPLFPLMQPGFPITHDGQDHVARIANFYQNLLDGNLIPRWAGNLNWGYGHPILMFLYPLPSFTASFFVFFGFSLPDSVKLVFTVAYIASAFAMYAFAKKLWSDTAALIAALVYSFAPYRFVDLYVRGAIGEHMAFVFPPLIMLNLVLLSKSINSRNIVFGALSLAGLILSHNAISLMFLPIIVGFGAYLFWHSEVKRAFVVSAISMLLFGFGVAAFFWIPALLEGKYTLRDIVTADDYKTRFVTVGQLLYGPWDFGGTGKFTVQIGIVHWLLFIISFPLGVILHRRKNKQLYLLVFFQITFFTVLFVMTEYSQLIWQYVSLLQKFQFPWRFLSVAVFVPATFAAIFVDSLRDKAKIISAVFFSGLLLLTTVSYWKAQGYQHRPESFYTGVYDSTTDTGESAPIWSVRFMERRPETKIAFISGRGSIEEIRRTSTLHEYRIQNRTDARLVENTLYFPGWSVRVNGQPVNLQFQDPQFRGLMTFNIPPGNHEVKIEFRETKLRLISDIISLASILGLLVLVILEKQWKRYL